MRTESLSPVVFGSALVLVLGLTGSPGRAHPAQSLDPDEFYVEGLKHGGSGCQQGGVSFNLAPASDRLAVSLGDYSTADSEIDTVSCVVRLQLHVPAGWSFAVRAADIRGFADLGVGARAEQSLVLLTPGAAQPRADAPDGSSILLAAHRWQGPMRSDFRITATVAQAPWSPCARGADDANHTELALRVDSAVLAKGAAHAPLSGPAAIPRLHPAVLRGVSANGELRLGLHLAWRRCAAGTAP